MRALVIVTNALGAALHLVLLVSARDLPRQLGEQSEIYDMYLRHEYLGMSMHVYPIVGICLFVLLTVALVFSKSRRAQVWVTALSLSAWIAVYVADPFWSPI